MNNNNAEHPCAYYPAWPDKVFLLVSETEKKAAIPILNATGVDVACYQSREVLPDNFYKVISTIL